MNINRVIISGNLTRDPELRSTQSGMAVLSFGVAVNDRANSLAQYLSKGTKVSIEGKLRQEQWERDGQKHSKLKVIVDELEFMSSRQSAPSAPQGHYHTAQPMSHYPTAPQAAYGAQPPLPAYGQPQAYGAPANTAAAVPAIDASSSVYDDDIPF